MATSNFSSKAGTIYAIEDTGDEFTSTKELTEYARELIEADQKIDFVEQDETDGDRNYTGTCWGSIMFKTTEGRKYGDLFAETALYIRSGYYSGANLDYETRVYNCYDGEYYELDELDDETIGAAMATLRKVSDKQLAKLTAEKRFFDTAGVGTAWILPTAKEIERAKKGLALDLKRLEKIVDRAYSEATVPLNKLAIFSNGETIYGRKKK